ncbi:hypothetical protein Barb6XT_02440 [Bacteroidales bacterium Barb6XT]|nr:hypothetical protein Barb6XT_02440 [Bacteroidales bacterium Barb6XT]
MRKSVATVVILLSMVAFLSCNKEETTNTDDVKLFVRIGNDTTIIYGDTLILDPGSGYALYEWNDGISDRQKLEVTEAGLYWVKVTDSQNRTGSDTIRVDTVPCLNKIVFFEDYYLYAPCSFIVENYMGDDSRIFEIRSAPERHNDIVIGYEYGSRMLIDDPLISDTVYQIPKEFRSCPNMLEIRDNSGKEVGICFYENSPDIYVEGYFLVKKENYYLVVLRLYYEIDKFSEMMEIINSINNK